MDGFLKSLSICQHQVYAFSLSFSSNTTRRLFGTPSGKFITCGFPPHKPFLIIRCLPRPLIVSKLVPFHFTLHEIPLDTSFSCFSSCLKNNLLLFCGVYTTLFIVTKTPQNFFFQIEFFHSSFIATFLFNFPLSCVRGHSAQVWTQ